MGACFSTWVPATFKKPWKMSRIYTIFKLIYESPGDAIFEVIQQWTIRLHVLFLLCPRRHLLHSHT